MRDEGMGVREAREILKIPRGRVTPRAITKAYHRLALKHHPDRGGTDASFLAISTAKSVLLDQTGSGNTVLPPSDGLWFPDSETRIRAEQVIKAGITYLTSPGVPSISVMLKRENWPLCVTSEFMKYVAPHSKVVTICPSLASALARLVHPLDVGGETFYVPLWHSQVEFDCNGCVLIVNVNITVPPHVTIDIDNVIHVNVSHRIISLLELGHLDLSIAGRSFRLPAASVRVVEKQSVSLGRVGLPAIDCHDTLNVSKTMEIVVHLTLTVD